MDPSHLPEFVHDIASWTRQSAGPLWCAKASQGSPFWWPAHLKNPTKDALALRAETYNRALSQSYRHFQAHAAALDTQRQSTLESYQQLANYHADTLERARLLYIGKDISYLAAKTEMKEFRLDLDLLRPELKSAPSACGFIMWDTPIGEAEPRGQLTAWYDDFSDQLIDVELTDDIMSGLRESETPINAASWRVLPGAEEILVVFYSDGVKARANYEAWVAQQKAPARMVLDKKAMLLQQSDPQPLEREQILPLGKTLGWFNDEEAKERLVPTVQSDPSYLREAERFHVENQFIEANKKYRPMLSQMVKTFVATLAIRRMKLVSREEIPPPRPSKKRMRRSGASEERCESNVEVIRIGRPLKRRSKSSGGGKWKVRTIVGPVIRTRQYVPAYDEYREGIWEIEPYDAGPEDAPWSDNLKMYLLD